MFDIVIGLEVHIQLNTTRKCFAPEANTFDLEANTHTSFVSLAHPGTLPRLNKQALLHAAQLSMALGAKVTRKNLFARKNYFYPDLPKGFQLTQNENPIGIGGHLEVRRKDGSAFVVQIHHLHLEEDAGKSMHLADAPFTALDYNRAGVPLVELVTEPCLHSAEDAAAFLQAVRRLTRYLGISDGNMEEGSLRCDANISLKPVGSAKLGTRVEIKNLNSFRFLQKAVAFEVARQGRLLQAGEAVVQETRTFDSQTGETAGMRKKEDAPDYRYFPEPDLAPIVLSEEILQELEQALPTLPHAWIAHWEQTYNLALPTCELLAEERETAQYFDALCQNTPHVQMGANWLTKEVRNYLNNKGETSITHFPLSPTQLASLFELVQAGKISQTNASQTLFPLWVQNPTHTAQEIADEHSLWLATDSVDWDKVITETLAEMPDKVLAYQKGKTGLLGMFIAEVRKRTQNQGDPKQISEWLKKHLSGNI
ncbi:MAG: Asp-tRNA(Asn)/Glu-tRNA(Gln) amidotransferase subunit GatB [Bacteroidetes bacterium]|nr:MAG: Asp-tRNA(Asn)/Glu-tRNA(Gln) amidotransferase subunit GatB [Bacteroidota bacterium]